METDRQAADVSELPELAGEDVAVGMHINLPPCISAAELAEEQRAGRECPRPAPWMDPDNEVALDLVGMSLSEDTRHLVEETLRDEVPRSERAAVRRRVAAALQSKAIATFRERQQEEAKARAKAKG